MLTFSSRRIGLALLTPLTLTVAAAASVRAQVPTTAAQADSVVATIKTLLHGQRTQESVDSAEAMLTRIDRMPDGFAPQRVAAHAMLNGFYRGVDVDPAIEAHSRAIMALVPQLDTAQRIALKFSLINAYSNLAEVYGDEGRADDAVALLKKAPSDLAGVPDVEKTLAPVLTRYEMIGKPAPYIEAEYWINPPANTPAGKRRIDFPTQGKVTVIEHTAWWCGPCHKSYEPIARVAKEIGPDKVRVIFATQLMGSFRKDANLTPDVELAKLSDYYIKENKIPFEVAVSANTPETAQANMKRYNCTGIPHVVVIDKAGNIRRILIGWDVGNEARLEEAIKAAL